MYMFICSPSPIFIPITTFVVLFLSILSPLPPSPPSLSLTTPSPLPHHSLTTLPHLSLTSPSPQHGDLVEYLCKCSFLEIYNEQVFDLLESASSGLLLRENMHRGVFVDGLSEQSVASARDAYDVRTAALYSLHLRSVCWTPPIRHCLVSQGYGALPSALGNWNLFNVHPIHTLYTVTMAS